MRGANQTSSIVPYGVATLGIATFSTMDVIMKGLSISLGAYNAMLWRMLVGIVLGGALFFLSGTRLPARSTFKLHVLRGAIAAFMATSFFWGLARVPLAEAVALSFIAPLITLYLAAVLLGEKISKQAIAATIMGFLGVLVILSARIAGEYQSEALKGSAVEGLLDPSANRVPFLADDGNFDSPVLLGDRIATAINDNQPTLSAVSQADRVTIVNGSITIPGGVADPT
ncbi:MAG: EamA family transporter, partial [Rhodocyclaceae bacterium]